jgi:hypothetical protein
MLVVGFVGAAVYLFDEYGPKPLVAESSASSDSPAFSIPFIIENVGGVVLRSATIYCRIGNVSDGFVRLLGRGQEGEGTMNIVAAEDATFAARTRQQLTCKWDQVFGTSEIIDAKITIVAEHPSAFFPWNTSYELGTFVWHPELDLPRWLKGEDL